jgi:hypothetical protein
MLVQRQTDRSDPKRHDAVAVVLLPKYSWSLRQQLRVLRRPNRKRKGFRVHRTEHEHAGAGGSGCICSAAYNASYTIATRSPGPLELQNVVIGTQATAASMPVGAMDGAFRAHAPVAPDYAEPLLMRNVATPSISMYQPPVAMSSKISLGGMATPHCTKCGAEVKNTSKSAEVAAKQRYRRVLVSKTPFF